MRQLSSKVLLSACMLIITAPSMSLAADAPATMATDVQSITSPKDQKVTTQHSIEIKGGTLEYTATAGNLVIKNEKNEPSASVFYVAYSIAPEDGEERPVTFIFNGGPGSSSLWLHMGSFGPKRVKTSNAKPTPTPPYTLLDNQYTLLQRSDLVFVDAFDTGFTRGIALDEEKSESDKNPASQYWGVDGDVDGFARFITRYVTVNERWNSPKFLMGESYGTIRAPALANKLQDDGMAFNGVILISSILNYAANAPGLDREYVGLLPTFAALGYYHKKLASQPKDLKAYMAEVREFAENEYALALAKGQALTEGEGKQLADKLQQYTGVRATFWKQANFRVGQGQFRKELLRDDEMTIGRYDGRFTSIDKDAIGEWPDTDASDTAPSPAFISTFNNYLTTSLNYHADEPYRVFSIDAFKNWDWSHKLPSGGKSRSPFVVDDLGSVMRKNPYLHVFSANGYYDLATPFHSTEYDLAHMQLPEERQNNITMAYYPSGHMLYLNTDALKTLHLDLEAFYQAALQK